LVALMVYSTVTLEPFLMSPFTAVPGVRAISHFSLPFSTTILVSVTSRTGPVPSRQKPGRRAASRQLAWPDASSWCSPI
jgi:hypothetical protein